MGVYSMKIIKFILAVSILLFGFQYPIVNAASLNGETTVNLNVRTTPSATGAVYKTLPAGTKIKYEPYNKSWHKVYLNNGTYYASAQYVRPLKNTPVAGASQTKALIGIATENLHVRQTSHSQAKIITTLKKGTEIQYAVHNSSWVKIFLNGNTYYAAKAFIAPKQVVSTPQKQSGYANREMKLFEKRNQTSRVLKVLPINALIVTSKYNASWSVVYEGAKTYYTPTAWITPGTSAQPPTTTQPPSPKPEETRVQGFANRDINLYGKTHQNSAILLRLPQNTAVTYRSYNSSWSVVYVEEKTFYTPSSWLTAGEAPATPINPPVVLGKVYTNTPGDSLNVRAMATASSTTLGQIAHGTLVEHYGSSNGFYKITYKGKEGFISTAYTSLTKPSAYTPSQAVIVLDAGHGGSDPGAINGSFYEKTVVLDVTKRIETYLRSKYNYQVRLTRSTDVLLTYQGRIDTARNLKGNLFVSIHANAAQRTDAQGIETFYSTSSAHKAKNRVLATNIQSKLTGKMTEMVNRGVKTKDFYVITYNTMPSALVELGFITSPVDVVHLRSDASRQLMAEGVAEGIAQYVRTYH